MAGGCFVRVDGFSRLENKNNLSLYHFVYTLLHKQSHLHIQKIICCVFDLVYLALLSQCNQVRVLPSPPVW